MLKKNNTMALIKNIFPVSNYQGSELFCDREDETNALIRNAENGLNTTLVSIRRMGKTGVIYNVFYELLKKNEIKCLYTDLYATQSLKDLTEQTALAIYNAFPEKQSPGKKFMKLLKSLSPVLSYDQLSGQPEIHFEYMHIKQYEHSLSALFSFLEEQQKPVLFAMDEFQQVATYPEKNTEALLRSIIQKLKNIHFIFSGSNKHLMHEVFNNQKRPFFASTQMLYLQPIPADKYLPFIRLKFEENKRTISDEALQFIGEWTRLHTWYTQVLCNRLYASKIKQIELHHVKSTCDVLLKESEGTFFQYRNLLTAGQWQFLKAIASEDTLYQPSSKEFLLKHKITTAGNVPRFINALLNKEMIYQAEENGKSYYRVYDCFLSRWLERL